MRAPRLITTASALVMALASTDYSIHTNLSVSLPLEYTSAPTGEVVKENTELRILCVGDSITVGDGSSDWNGYRGELKALLSESNELFFAGDQQRGTLPDGYFAAWGGQTIQYMDEHVGPSLEQRPNIILLHAGTNDMSARPERSVQGNDPTGAANRLGVLIDQMAKACPDAVIIVAIIISSCDEERRERESKFQSLIPGVVKERIDTGKHVLVADFTTITGDYLRKDCIHPNNNGYKEMGRYWYDFLTQVPKSWIQAPIGGDPEQPERGPLVGPPTDPDDEDHKDGAGRFGTQLGFLTGLASMVVFWHTVF
ncbi:GDSL-like Lipase/Acylhydrolase [Verticillium dahliae]